jgi:CHAD domain-containing protein
MNVTPDATGGADDTTPATSPPLVLELALAPGEARRLPYLLRGNGRRRATPLRLTWHDTPDYDLAADGLALVERQHGRERGWRLERMAADGGEPWLPGTPCPVLAEAAEAVALNVPLPAPLTPMVGFEGRTRTLAGPDGVAVSLISGMLRAAAVTRPCCRVVLDGPAEAVTALSDALAGPLHLYVPATSLAAEAMALAGRPAPRRHHAPPALAADHPVGEAFAHLVARLTEAILSEAPHAGPTVSEPVHQMRVAVRRLRSAVALFGKATHCPELAAGKAALQDLAKVLGPARDWDVFAEGTGHAVAATFAGDAAVERLLNTAERRRLKAYAALHRYLASARFRRLGIALAALAAARPWERPRHADDAAAAARQAERLTGSLADFAAKALGRRLRALSASGDDIATLPTETLHGLRLHGKRLRYVAEFCAPLFPGHGARRFIRRLTTLQERLGHLNDGAVAAGLMAELGAERGHAGGVVRGFVAAQSAGARARIAQAWRRFHRLDPFWS